MTDLLMLGLLAAIGTAAIYVISFRPSVSGGDSGSTGGSRRFVLMPVEDENGKGTVKRLTEIPGA